MNLVERDKQAIWHPFTQMKTGSPPVAIQRAEGVWLYDENGKGYIDAISSWWVNIHGHSHPYIAQRVYEQFQQLEHVIFAGFTHPPAVDLAEQLLEILPNNQGKVFYSDNGSTAVEVGLKMAVQYWYNVDQPKHKILAFTHSYHGDTFGSMSVSSRDAFNKPFHQMLFEVDYIDPPTPGNEAESLNQLNKALEQEDYAGFVFEPLVQGVGGMIMHDAQALNPLIKTCQEHNVLTIADEVMVGFGRTGKIFASDHLKHNPDIISLSKGLTGGAMAMGITTCTNEIYQAFYSEDKMKTFFHGHSFTANPLACTAALASLDLLQSFETRTAIDRITKKHLDFKPKLQDYEIIKDLRQQGTILAIELEDSNGSYFSNISNEMYRYFMLNGILLRPLGNVLYIMPPYVITDEQLDAVYNTIINYLDDLQG